MTTPLNVSAVLPRLNAALAAGKLLVLWAEMPFPPEAEAPPNAAARIAQWQRAASARPALPALPWSVWETPPLPILSLDPSPRLAEAFRMAGVPLTVVAARRDVPVAGRHSLLQLAGDLSTRSGLWLAWTDVRTARSDPDKAYLLQEAARVARESVVLVLAAQPGPDFARLWDDLLAPTLRAEAVYGAGAASAAWPAGISPVAGDPAAWLGQLRRLTSEQTPPTPAGLERDLLRRCRTALLRCAELESNAALRAVFVTAELAPFRNGLPEAESKAARVDQTLAYLQSRQLRDGRAVLPLFLAALAERYDPGDALHGELHALAQALTAGAPAATPPTSAAPTSAELRPRLVRFDDAELDALCLDHFPAVYDKFGRGQRRDEKINLLLDHCRRNPESGAQLTILLAARQAAAIPPQSPAAGRNLTPITPSAALPTGLIRQRWALLVGVDTYIDPAFPRLKYCTADVLALQAALEAAGYTVVALHDNASAEHLRPTRDNVEAELARICQAAGPDDLVWAHFSCHGKLVDGQPVLITREVRAPTLARKALPLAEVERELRGSQARRRVLTLDACHTGVELGRDLADPDFIRNVHELAEGFALLATSTSQQIAQEWDAQQHGVFTYFLLEGLRSPALRGEKGFVTVGDLALHTLDNLRRWNVTHGGILQEPTARVEGLGDIILADFRAAPPANGNPGGGRNGVAPNPFMPLTGRVTDPARVFDRDRELRRVVEFLQAGSSVALIGPAAVGKSSLLTRLVAELPERMGAPWETAYLDLQPIYNEKEFFGALCDALSVATCRGYPLHSALRERRIVLAVDEVDKMTWEGFSRSLRTELRGLACDGIAPLKLLLAARQPLDVLFPDSEGDTSPLANICLQVDVGPWDEANARAFLIARLEATGVAFTEVEIARLIAASGGYPQRLVQAAYALFAQKAVM